MTKIKKSLLLVLLLMFFVHVFCLSIENYPENAMEYERVSNSKQNSYDYKYISFENSQEAYLYYENNKSNYNHNFLLMDLDSFDIKKNSYLFVHSYVMGDDNKRERCSYNYFASLNFDCVNDNDGNIISTQLIIAMDSYGFIFNDDVEESSYDLDKSIINNKYLLYFNSAYSSSNLLSKGDLFFRIHRTKEFEKSIYSIQIYYDDQKIAKGSIEISDSSNINDYWIINFLKNNFIISQ